MFRNGGWIQNIVDYVSSCHPVFLFPYVPLPILERLFRPSGSLELFDYPCLPFNGGVLRDVCKGNLATGYYKRFSSLCRKSTEIANICHIFLAIRISFCYVSVNRNRSKHTTLLSNLITIPVIWIYFRCYQHNPVKAITRCLVGTLARNTLF